MVPPAGQMEVTSTITSISRSFLCSNTPSNLSPLNHVGSDRQPMEVRGLSGLVRFSCRANSTTPELGAARVGFGRVG